MKRFADIFGLFVALIIGTSAFMKAQHLPGSAILFIFSLGLLLPLYFLFTLIVRFREKKAAVGLIAPGFFAGMFVLGVLFSIMHWPGGAALSFVGFWILVLILLILSIINIARKPQDQKLSPTVLIFAIIAVSLVYAGMSKNVSKGNLVSNFLANDNESALCNSLEKQNAVLYNQLDSVKKTATLRFKKSTAEVVGFIAELRHSIFYEANGGQEYLSYADINGIDNTDIASFVLRRNDNVSELKYTINRYKSEIEQLKITEELKQELLKALDFGALQHLSPGKDWTESYFENVTVISAGATLASIQARILRCENDVYNELIK